MSRQELYKGAYQNIYKKGNNEEYLDIAELPRYARDIQHSFEITVQEYEAFHVLLRHKGWYSAEEIRSFIAQNRVARSQMYNVLKSLESKNLITSKKQGRKILYKINLSEEILTPFLQQEKQLEKQQRHVSDLIEMLQQVNEHAEENWHIDIIPIRNQGELWEFFDSILHEAEGTILYTFLRHGGTKKIINPQAWNDYEKKLIEKDITLKSFMDQEKLTKHYKHWNKRLATQFGITTKDIDRLLFENIKQEYIKVQGLEETPCDIIISPHALSFLIIGDRDPITNEYPINAVIIRNKTIGTFVHLFFSLIWNMVGERLGKTLTARAYSDNNDIRFISYK